MKVAIVVGHSESSQGAVGTDGVQEWTFHHQRARQLDTRLPSSKVFLRNRGTYTKAMRELVGRINRWRPELVCSLHFNALNGTFSGSLALHWPGSRTGETRARELSAAAATAIGIRDRGPRSQDRSWSGAPLYILRDTRAPAVILETHYGDHASDHDKATVALNEGTLADALAGVLSG